MRRGVIGWSLCLVGIIALLAAGCWGPSKPEPAPAPKAPVEQPKPAAPPAAPAPPAAAQPAAPPAAPAVPKPAQKVSIYRDTWGVPHIYAETAADAAFGLGYAQAEDRIEDIYRNIRTAIGSSAEVFGKGEGRPNTAETDFLMRLIKNAESCEKLWESAPVHLKELGDNFMAGVTAYITEHPEKKPEWATELHGWQCAAIGRTMILRWPVGEALDDLGHKEQAPPFASNEWSVAPSRSAEKCAILLTDPHLQWEGMSVFYEARVFGGDLALCGFFLVGSPVLALGHNANVGWACTTGGPDTSDCYKMKLNPENPMQYEYDGKWLDAEVKPVKINVKDDKPLEQPAAYTILGPVIDLDLKAGVAYVAAIPYLDQSDLFEQMYRMCTAKNCDEFHQALAMNQFMEQNVMFADREGNIEYVRGGRVPIRPKGYNWSAPVPGNTSATKWLGIHPIDDLVQIKNPAQGYMENCNVSPANMMVNSPLKQENYPDYIWKVTWDTDNPRSRRIRELLEGDNSITKEKAMAIAFDVFDLLAKPWQDFLKKAVKDVGANKMGENEVFAKSVEQMLAWNGEYTPDSVAAPLFKFWRLKCEGNNVDVEGIIKGKKLGLEDRIAAIELLSQTIEDLKTRYGNPNPAWGDIHKVGRGDKLFPAPGADFGGGPDKIDFSETPFDVRSSEGAKGLQIADNGSMATALMFFHADGIESYTCTPWGQSGDPASPHYMDQGEKLYSTRTFKPTWFKKEELMANVATEKVLGPQ